MFSPPSRSWCLQACWKRPLWSEADRLRVFILQKNLPCFVAHGSDFFLNDALGPEGKFLRLSPNLFSLTETVEIADLVSGRLTFHAQTRSFEHT